MSLADPIRIVRRVAAVFQEMKIPYMVGGSLASSMHGIPRATQDADIVADLAQADIKKIIALLSPEFYIDEEMAKDAVKRRSSFNIIDKEELFKIDIFIPALDEISSIEMERRISFRVDDADEQPIYVCTPEDIIAHKLYWYKLGEGASERQWNDAINVIKVQRNCLDYEYLRRTSRARGVLDLLGKALSENQPTEPLQ
jgi:hypothetical protein